MSRPPEPTSADLANWRKLVREARKAAAAPAAPCGDLSSAERMAKRSIVLGPMSALNPCIQLVRRAGQFAASTVRQRREQAPALIEACEDVEARLKSPAAATGGAVPPARRHRADIDG
ncbi:MAG: hypothetical protein Q8L59_11215 [Phenylobacterium sp.]|uniref:hypothetical protein n=1 Tax=Phenylobacterium sp. TaxID=1871053 RepID=UPI002732835A|nr:hypothetical protein [Phenylobacterium sp.]MDP1642744.1 hypothetical protein [Phenylobacterium sp.]MDP3117208.1 hypothetical protein [Phenylobacterium sp.]